MLFTKPYLNQPNKVEHNINRTKPVSKLCSINVYFDHNLSYQKSNITFFNVKVLMITCWFDSNVTVHGSILFAFLQILFLIFNLKCSKSRIFSFFNYLMRNRKNEEEVSNDSLQSQESFFAVEMHFIKKEFSCSLIVLSADG